MMNNDELGLYQKKKSMHDTGFWPKRKQNSGNAKASPWIPLDTRHDTDLLETMYVT